MAAEATVNVTVRVGLLGKLAIALVRLAHRVVPLGFVVWAVNRSCYMRLDRGRWRKFSPGLSLEDYR